MSLPSGNPTKIDCAGFAGVFDEYVDQALEPAMADAATRHVGACPACDREVTRWQQTRILLSTAVTDLATAVDVSGLRGDVMAALGSDSGAASVRLGSAAREVSHRHVGREAAQSSATREAAVDRGGDDSRRHGGAAARREAKSARRGGFVAAGRFISAATLSAVTAAAAVLLLSPVPQQSVTTVASSRSAAGHSTYQPAAFIPGLKDFFAEPAPATYAPPPLARPKPSHVDGLEAAPGQFVSTWVQPGTNARVIWVQDRGLGAPVRTAGLDR